MRISRHILLAMLVLAAGVVGATAAQGFSTAAVLALALAIWATCRIHDGSFAPFIAPEAALERTGYRGEPATVIEAFASQLSTSQSAADHLDEVLETMAGALIVADPDRRILRVNRAALELTGFESLAGKVLDEVFPEDRPVNTGSLVQVSSSGRVRGVERIFRHRNGSELPVLFSGSALRGKDGELRQYVCVAYDIRHLKALEAQLRASVDEKELLLREVHHRVKNNLQVISSLLDLQADQLQDARDLELIRDSRQRIRSMALIHEQLYRHDDLSRVALGPYLENLAGHLFRSYGIEPGRVVLRCRLSSVATDLDRAVACGLIVNELISNSLEHAFGSQGKGVIHLTLQDFSPADGGEDDVRGCVRLEVADDGCGFVVEADHGPSMGLELVAMMVEQLGGRLTIESAAGGSICTVDFAAGES